MIKFHLDTDIGGDIDDLCALAMVLNWPDVELLAVTTNTDDGGKRAGYARYVLDLAGQTDTPVAAGADVALDCYRWNGQTIRPGLPDEAQYWPKPIPALPAPLDHALDLLESSIAQGAVIVAIGACTNLALLEKRTPGILRRAQLYLMGGYVFPPRPGFPAWNNEMDWNIQCDVQSAYDVIQHANPTFVPLSVTVETSLRVAYLDTLRAAGALGRLIVRQAEAFAQDENNRPADLHQHLRQHPWRGLPQDTINFLHDPLACAVALGWRDGIEIHEVSLATEIKGELLHQTVVRTGKPTQVVTRIDGDKFSRFWLQIVTRHKEGSSSFCAAIR